jgi:hypothetical protein
MTMLILTAGKFFYVNWYKNVNSVIVSVYVKKTAQILTNIWPSLCEYQLAVSIL